MLSPVRPPRPRRPRLEPVHDKAMHEAVSKINKNFGLVSKRKSRIAEPLAARRLREARDRRRAPNTAAEIEVEAKKDAEEKRFGEEKEQEGQSNSPKERSGEAAFSGKALTPTIDKQEAAATLMQAAVRGHQDRRKSSSEAIKKKRASTVIQARVRGTQARTNRKNGEIRPTALTDLWSMYKEHDSNQVPMLDLAKHLWQCFQDGMSAAISRIVPQQHPGRDSTAGRGAAVDPTKPQVFRLIELHLHKLRHLKTGEQALQQTIIEGQERWQIIQNTMWEAEVVAEGESDWHKLTEIFCVNPHVNMSLKDFRRAIIDFQMLTHLDEEHMVLSLAWAHRRQFELPRITAEMLAQKAMVRQSKYKPYRWKLKSKVFIRLFRFLFRRPDYFDELDEDSDDGELMTSPDEAELEDQQEKEEAEKEDADLREKMEVLFLKSMLDMPKIIASRKTPQDEGRKQELKRDASPEPVMSQADLDALVKKVDRNRDDKLIYKEFQELVFLICKKRKMLQPPESIITETFNDFDLDHCGSIKHEQLHAVSYHLQLKLQAVRQLEGRCQLAVMLEIFWLEMFSQQFKSPLDLSMAILCQSRTWQSE